jgi:hypothetical protein
VSLSRRARQFFGPSDRPSSPRALYRQTESFHEARIVVRCYYVVVLFFAAAALHDWSGYLERREVLTLWPVWWLDAVSLRAGMLAILGGYLAAAFWGAVFPDRRWARTLVFVGLLEFVALDNSFGKISHNHHLWVLTAFLLVFLPDAPARTADRATRQRFTIIFWSCQAIVLLTYTMSGVGKVAGAAYQLLTGQNNILLPSGGASIIAGRLLQTNSSSWLGPWLIGHPWFGWPLILAAVYLELFAFWAAFRPSLQRWWAAGLILFHVGVYLVMSIAFSPAVMLVGLLFLASPFRHEEPSYAVVIKQLPVLSWFARKVFRSL